MLQPDAALLKSLLPFPLLIRALREAFVAGVTNCAFAPLTQYSLPLRVRTRYMAPLPASAWSTTKPTSDIPCSLFKRMVQPTRSVSGS